MSEVQIVLSAQPAPGTLFGVKLTVADVCYAKRQVTRWKNGEQTGADIIASAPAKMHIIWVRGGTTRRGEQQRQDLIAVPGDQVPVWLLSDDADMERQLAAIDAWWFDVARWTGDIPGGSRMPLPPASECWVRFSAAAMQERRGL